MVMILHRLCNNCELAKYSKMSCKAPLMARKIFIGTIILFFVCNCGHTQPRLAVESGKDIYVGNNEIFFSSDNTYLGLTNQEEIRIYDLKTGMFLKKIKSPYVNNYSNVKFSRDFKRYTYSRLQTTNESNESNAYDIVAETFTDSIIYKRHHITNATLRYLKVLDNCIFSVNYDSLLIINQKGDSTSYKTYDWKVTHDEKFILLPDGSLKYNLLNLNTNQIEKKIDFTKISPPQISVEEKKATKEYGSPFISKDLFFTDDDHFLVLSGELWGKGGQVFKVFDIQKDTVIFSKVYPVDKFHDEIFYNAVNFSSISGTVTLPDTTGLMVFNIYTQDSTHIAVNKADRKVNAYLCSDGYHIVLEEKDKVRLINSKTNTLEYEYQMNRPNVVINPVYPIIYIQDGGFYKPQAFAYNFQEKKIVSIIEGHIKKITNDGKIIYGDVELRNFLLNKNLEPIRAINNCTPQTEEILTTNSTDHLIFRKSGMCEFINKEKREDFDFKVWNMNMLLPLKNDLEGKYRFMLRENGVEKYAIWKNNFFMKNFNSLMSLTDTINTNSLGKQYGDLLCMLGTYSVFTTNNYFLGEDSIGNNSITILKDFNTVVTSFKVAGIPANAIGLDTVLKRVLLIFDKYDSKGDKYVLSVRNYKGNLIQENKLQWPSYLTMLEIKNVHISTDYKTIYISLIRGNGKKEITHLIFDLRTGNNVFDLVLPENNPLYIDFVHHSFAAKDTNDFILTGMWKPFQKKITKTYPICIQAGYMLGFKADGIRRDGKILIQGGYILSKARVCNRIKGGSVQIN